MTDTMDGWYQDDHGTTYHVDAKRGVRGVSFFQDGQMYVLGKSADQFFEYFREHPEESLFRMERVVLVGAYEKQKRG